MEVKIETTSDGRRLQEALNKLTNCSVKIGWFEGQPYPDGASVAEVAMTQEYGSTSDHIPPRPFMRPAILENEKTLSAIVEKGSIRILKNEMTIETLFSFVGAETKNKIQEKIVEVTHPPLAPATIYARIKKKKNKTVTGSLAKPLIDTGHMLRTVDYIVEK